MPLVACPHCQKQMDVAAELMGSTVACPHCRRDVAFLSAAATEATLRAVDARLQRVEAQLLAIQRGGSGRLMGSIAFVVGGVFSGALVMMQEASGSQVGTPDDPAMGLKLLIAFCMVLYGIRSVP